tara:strand:- start:284 stop:490 length:207 start_codon:yes stop_codon:yes gene_type:complete
MVYQIFMVQRIKHHETTDKIGVLILDERFDDTIPVVVGVHDALVRNNCTSIYFEVFCIAKHVVYYADF